VKEYLSKKGIQFTEYDVEKDRARAMEMVQKTKQMGVPVTIVDETNVIIGFDQPKLDRLFTAPAGGAPQQ
jgi:glutaredoxin 3